MVKIQISMRIDPKLMLVVSDLSKNMKIGSKTAVFEIAVYEFCERNKDKIESQNLLVYMEYLKMQAARENTKMEMRKATFKRNAVRKLAKLIRDGITEDRFNELIKVWCIEAEANGMNTVEFLESFTKELSKIKGSGLNEI